MLSFVPPSLHRLLHAFVLAVFACAAVGGLAGLVQPTVLVANLANPTGSEEEKSETEREGAKAGQTVFPPGSSHRRNLSRYPAAPGTLIPPALPRPARSLPISAASPADALVAAGAGLFQRC